MHESIAFHSHVSVCLYVSADASMFAMHNHTPPVLANSNAFDWELNFGKRSMWLPESSKPIYAHTHIVVYQPDSAFRFLCLHG